MEDAMGKTTRSSIRQLFDSTSVLRGIIADNTKRPLAFEGGLAHKALYAIIPTGY